MKRKNMSSEDVQKLIEAQRREFVEFVEARRRESAEFVESVANRILRKLMDGKFEIQEDWVVVHLHFLTKLPDCVALENTMFEHGYDLDTSIRATLFGFVFRLKPVRKP